MEGNKIPLTESVHDIDINESLMAESRNTAGLSPGLESSAGMELGDESAKM